MGDLDWKKINIGGHNMLGEAFKDFQMKLKSLKNIACGGAISPADLIIEINEKLPNAKFTNHYGQSETGPICIYSHYHPNHHPKNFL